MKGITHYSIDLSSVFENAKVGIAFVDADGNWEGGNENFLRVTGYTEEEFLRKNWNDIFEINSTHPGFSTIKADSSKRLSPFELKVIRRDGAQVWLNVFLLPRQEARFACIAEDITREVVFKELDQLERNVLEKNALSYYTLNDVLDQFIIGLEQIFPDMICSLMKVVDQRVYCWASRRLPDAYLKQINGAPIGPKAGSCGTAAFLKTAVLVADISTDFRWEEYKSAALPYGLQACWSHPIISASERVLATFAIYYKKKKSPEPMELDFIDRSSKILAIILENHENIQSLKESDQRFQYVREATSEAIWDADLPKGTVVWSQGYHTLFGHAHREEEMPGSSWSDFIHPDDFREVTDSIQKVINGRKKTWTMEYRFRKSDGQYLRVEDKGLVVRDQQGKPLRMVGAMRDVSAQYEYRRSLEELNRILAASTRDLEATNAELERYAYIASHHLQEPLRMVIGFMDKLYRSQYSTLDEKSRKYLSFARNGAEHMRKQILDLLEYSTIGKEGQKFQSQWVDSSSLVNEVLAEHQAYLDETGARVQVRELPRIWGNKKRLFQVFEHLFINAITYRPPMQVPEIDVSSYREKGMVIFSVKDNGLGIDKAYHQKIFLLFQRLHSRDQFSGTGTGLPVCKKIVENHGGNIWLESEPGKGCTFFFSVPDQPD